MNAFSKPTNTKPDFMKVRHGRKGQPTEYVEYQPIYSNIRFVAQKSGEWFLVWRVEVNKRGRIHSFQQIGSFTSADDAAHQAHDTALQMAQD